MSIRIITGSTGTNHVTSQDDGSLNQVILGSKSVVLDIGEKMAATVVDNNTVRISDGDLLLQGRHARIDAGTVEDMTIGTGTIEMNRNDLIVARYTLDVVTGFENIELIVLEGAESTGSASDPAYNTGDIRTGSSIVDFPLYRVRIEGINIVGLVRLFEISGGANSSLIGNAYSATKSYKSGEYCIDNGIMWRSRIDNNIGNTPAENSYWTRASIANDVSTLNQNLTAQDGLKFDFQVDDSGNYGILNKEGEFMSLGASYTYLKSENLTFPSGNVSTQQIISLPKGRYIVFMYLTPDYIYNRSNELVYITASGADATLNNLNLNGSSMRNNPVSGRIINLIPAGSGTINVSLCMVLEANSSFELATTMASQNGGKAFVNIYKG